MRLHATLFAGTALILAAPAYAAAQSEPAPAPETTADQPQPEQTEPAPPGAAPAQPQEQEIVVTARKRQERLKDVPVAATAITGEVIERRGLVSIKDVATLTPSLNVNSDGAGRVFVAIRGVGVTLVQTVQPGVGIFIDGIYQPNTSYLNNPLVDVERVEVLRGPQGTVYGKNTLGGAINVITRQPTNDFEVRGGGSYAWTDDAWNAFGSVSGPIVKDRLQFRIAAAHRQQDGFIRNGLLGTDANPLNMDTVNGTLRAEPMDNVVLTLNGYTDWVKGGSIPYAHVTGPTDYLYTVLLNAKNYQYYRYSGLNGKLQFPIAAGDTKVTLLGAFDGRKGRNPDFDADFNAVDIIRQRSRDKLETGTAELRFDSHWSDSISTLFGLFYSHESLRGSATSLANSALPVIGPITVVSSTFDRRKGDTYAAFGTLFWKPRTDLEVAFGLRVDHENREASGALTNPLAPVILFGSVPISEVPDAPLSLIVPEAKIKSTKVLPKVSVTKFWNRDFMSYASISRGFRGGGFNGPTAPFRTYKGDTAWTYEIGTKYSSSDRRFSASGAIFYNDYQDYIGLNQFVPGSDGRAVTVDFNTGDVKSYGAELEASFKPVPAWTLSGGLSYVHARITDSSPYTAVTGKLLGSKRLPFQPDWTFNVNSDYVVPLGRGDLTFNAGVVGKGSRISASLSETRVPVLKSYALVNGGITYRIGEVEIGAFVNNLLNAKYYESYIERTTLANFFCVGQTPAQCAANPLVSDLGIPGDRRRYGIRARFRF